MHEPVTVPHPRNDMQDGIDYQERIKATGYAPLPNCPVCQGAGFVHPITVDGKAIYSRIVPCKYTGCLVDSKQSYQSGESFLKRIGVSNPDQTFNTFEQYMGTELSYGAFYNLAFVKDAPPLLLCYGGTGNGKSHLCNALAIELNRSMVVRLYPVADMVSQLKQAMNTNTVEREMQFVKSVQVLILDDYGTNYGSDWEKARIDEIIDSRYRHEKITVMTTNLDFTQLPERVLSRFSDKNKGVVVQNSGADRRMTR